ncbi:hypothetical protein B0F90DRAFT_213447 [Multifurca ochricompacta]|uniref:Uncharacterized protein n=1 Tax=Multifurca ochricompacta TaxID=376703 RepID=A0AAD4QPD0_9AGAM|nr:hypothetical protein B0F90DRAFT_213447 [Multifurca ochricompacta]
MCPTGYFFSSRYLAGPGSSRVRVALLFQSSLSLSLLPSHAEPPQLGRHRMNESLGTHLTIGKTTNRDGVNDEITFPYQYLVNTYSSGSHRNWR